MKRRSFSSSILKDNIERDYFTVISFSLYLIQNRLMLLTATKIHNGHHFLPEGSVIEVNDEGTIVAIHNAVNDADVQHFDGILCPGFVNVHCHLELSHLKGYFEEGKGLVPFLQQVPLHRGNFTEEQKAACRKQAYEELVKNGVVAVGDIANVTDTLDVRALNKLHVHSFIEAIGFTETHATQRMEAFEKVYEDFAAQQQGAKMLRQSIVPHAPYSVSEALFKLIDQHQPSSIISIHNQESIAENRFYEEKTGPILDLLGGFGIDYSFFFPTGATSLKTYGEWLSPTHPTIFVHNTYSSIDDVQWAKQRFQNAYWCLCPNANIFLEETVPNVDMFIAEDVNICIGTDSLASNHQLCILSELLTLKEHFPALSWGTLIQWGTWNGAKALQMDSVIGSFEPGKQPGIVLIQEPDAEPTVMRII